MNRPMPHPVALLIVILLTYSRLGGLDGFALSKERSFYCCFLLASLAKSSNKRTIFGGLRPLLAS
jgi:hypothetical protein